MEVANSAKDFAGSTQAADLAILGFVQGGEEISNTIAQLLLFGKRLQTQETTLAELNDQLGTTFTSLDDLATNIVNTQSAQIKAIGEGIMIDDDLSPEDKIRAFQKAVTEATGIADEQTLNLIAARAGFEDLVSTFQADTFDVLMNNFEGLSEVVAELTTNLNNLLNPIRMRDPDNLIQKDPNSGVEYIPMGQDGLAFGTGDVAVTGEAGPELVRFGSTGEVINNSTSSQIMGAASGIMDAMASPTTTPEATVATNDRIVEPAATVNNNTSDDLLKKINDTLDQSNMIQSNILKETKRSKGFQY
jgi:hypothetical protein